MSHSDRWFVEKLEEAATHSEVDYDQEIAFSQAISLKRIADALEAIALVMAHPTVTVEQTPGSQRPLDYPDPRRGNY